MTTRCREATVRTRDRGSYRAITALKGSARLVLKQQHQIFAGLFVVADVLVVSVASFAAWLTREWIQGFPNGLPKQWESFPKQALVTATVPIMLLSLWFFGLYRPRRDRSLLNETATIFKASMLAMLGVLAALYIRQAWILVPDGPPVPMPWFGGEVLLDAGRVQIGLLTVFIPTMLSVHRAVFRTLLRSLRRRGWNLRHVAIIGDGRLGQIVARTLDRNSWTGLKVSYFIAHTHTPRRTECDGRPVLGGLLDLETLLARNKPDAVYVAIPGKHSDAVPAVLTRLEKFPVDVRIVPDFSPRYVPQSMSVNELDGMPILSYRESPTNGLGGITKRVLDIAGGALALLAFTPLMLLIAAMVRLSGPGPVIFKQRRVSIGGELFDICKFRTMYHVADERGAAPAPAKSAPRSTDGWTKRNDPRITRIGRWLRRTSLDELPQLFNVLAGEMSLVGPRPERPELIERFREDWRGYMLRQHVKAGITGWAQINGHRGDSSLRKRLQYDLFYVKNWSLGFDLKIILLTFVRGFVHRNAH